MLMPTRADAAGHARAAVPLPRAGMSTPAAWILAALLILGAVLRFATLGTQSYWFDEAQAAHEVGLSFGALISSLTTHETNPPLYFVLGWLWARLFGTGEVALRSLSALCGVAVIALAYACGRELVSRRAGLLAAALAACSPFLIWYSQEAREYMLLAALSSASLLLFARARHRGASARQIAAWGILSALALLTHFFAAFLVWPEAVWLLAVHRRRATVGACAGLLAVQVALLPFALTHATHSLLGFVQTTSLAARAGQVPATFAVGSLAQSHLVALSWLGAAAVAAAVILLLVAGAPGRELRGAGTAAALAACVLVLPWLAALTGQDFYIARALMPAWVPLCVVVAAACTASRTRAAGGALAVVLIGLFIYGQLRVQSDALYQRPNWRGVAHALGAAGAGRAIILYDGGLATDPLAFYLPRVPWQQNLARPVTVSEIDVVGSSFDQVAHPLPPGTVLLGTRLLDSFRVARFGLSQPLTASGPQAAARAAGLLTPAPAAPAVLIQRAPSGGARP
jgi:mannosyltransferase